MYHENIKCSTSLNLFSLFFSSQLCPREIFILTVLVYPYKPNKAQAQTWGVVLVVPVSCGCRLGLCWPGLLCQCLDMVWGCGLELLPRNSHVSLDGSLNANCDMPKQGLKPESVLVLLHFIRYSFWTILSPLLLERMIKGT